MSYYAYSAFLAEGHWLFSWRYLLVVEKLAQATKSRRVCSPCCLKIANIVLTTLIAVEGVVSIVYSGNMALQDEYVSPIFDTWSVKIFQVLYIAIDTCVLLYAMIRIRMLLKKIDDASLNVTFMTLHFALLVLLVLLGLL
jgi:hypothetical protein